MMNKSLLRIKRLFLFDLIVLEIENAEMSATTENSILKCRCCSSILQVPINLPCGDTICQKHVGSSAKGDTFKCPICKEIHSIQANGFPKSKLIQELLDKHYIKLNTSKPRREAIQACTDLEQQLNMFKQISRDQYIKGYMACEINKVNVTRAKHIEKLTAYYAGIVNEMRQFEQKCLVAAANNSAEYSFKNYEALNKKFEDGKQFLNSFEFDEARWKNIRNEMKASQENIKLELGNFKDSLLMNKVCKFEERVIQIDSSHCYGRFDLRDKTRSDIALSLHNSDYLSQIEQNIKKKQKNNAENST